MVNLREIIFKDISYMEKLNGQQFCEAGIKKAGGSHGQDDL